ncbi:MAG TPA: hypothetical protein VHZ51_03170 [Ktedonobacteraceae bacterium]|nr:hypothetical protein [Ktedonobacteraceae bacterium]
MTITTHSNIRHCRRFERRLEIALVIGPVAPPTISSDPVFSDVEVSEIGIN